VALYHRNHWHHITGIGGTMATGLSTEMGIRLVCRNPNFQNLNENGEVDIFSELMISILSTMSDFEKKLIKERQKEGIEKAKIEGRYTGRKSGTNESSQQFLNKPKSQGIIQAIRKGYSVSQITEKWSCSYATINKVVKAFNEVYGVDLMDRKVNHLIA
jgi:DNA invertase Pin-like site-specific DNA recombinase